MEDTLFRKSWVPHLLLAILTASVLMKMLARPYSCCDDLSHYFTLNQYLNGSVPIETPGGRLHAIHSMLVGIRLIFVPFAWIFQCLGAEYPLLAASKLWALLMLVASYAAWAFYLRKPLGRSLGAWAALAVVFFSTINHIIPAGLARSTNVLLLALWCLALRKRSPALIAGLLLAVSLLYPVIAPLLGLSLFAATAWAWRNQETAGRRAGILVSGFVASTAYMVIRFVRGFAEHAQTPMSYSEIMEVLNGGTFSPNLDVPRLMGLLADQSLVEWFQFNVFYHWGRVSLGFILVIVGCTLTLCLMGYIFIKTSSNSGHSRMIWLAGLVPMIAGIAAYREADLFLASCWFMTMASLGWLIVPRGRENRILPLELKLLIPSSMAAFVAVHLACYYIFVTVLDPGRQLQKTFSILAPILTVMFIARLVENMGFRHKRLVAALAGSFLFVYGCWALDLGYKEYKDEQAMGALKALPAGSEILCHPKTANFVLLMAAKGASTADELVRIGAQPYTNDLIAAYARDVDLVYSTGPEKLRNWCGQSPQNRYILIEPEVYTPRKIKRLFSPYNQAMEQRRQDGYYLNDLESPCREVIGESTSLVSCDCFLQEELPSALPSEKKP